MFWLVVAVVVAVVAWVSFGKSRLAIRLRGFFKRKTDDVTNSIGKGLDEHTERIETSKKELVDFRREIAKFTSKNKMLEDEHARFVAEAEKWDNLSKRAAEENNLEHVRTCLKNKKDFERKASAISQQIKSNQKALEQLHSQAQQQDDKISEHEVSTAVLAAKEAGLRMRQKMVNSSSAFGGENSLGDLSAYEEQLREKEYELDALDNMAGKDADLEAVYGESGTSSVNDEAEALIASMKKDKETVYWNAYSGNG